MSVLTVKAMSRYLAPPDRAIIQFKRLAITYEGKVYGRLYLISLEKL